MGKTSEEDEESTSVYTTPHEIANLVIVSRMEDCIFMKRPLSGYNSFVSAALSDIPCHLSHTRDSLLL
jgi:hypothetical protein